MSLRLQINAIITLLLSLMAALLIGLQIDNTRRSVHEEVVGANVVASQLLNRVNWAYGYGGLQGMREFLQGVGRVRANDIALFDDQGQELYRSPSSPYKPGRAAPPWFERIVSPPLQPREIELPNGRIVLRADPSRATLDGWDDLRPMLLLVLVGFLVANALVYGVVGRALQPVLRVTEGLRQMESGLYATRMPERGGKEGRLIAQAFNRMAQAVQENAEARRQALQATQALAENRELAQRVHTRLELERRAIARELHDELGQQLTAIKSAGWAVARHPAAKDAALRQSAELVLGCADALYADMHRLVARLRPLALDQFGLTDALTDLSSEWRRSHPDVAISLDLQGELADLSDACATAAFRIVQEAVNNALRHAQARRIAIALHRQEAQLHVSVRDDGQGQLDALDESSHFGVAGMRERAQALGGEVVFEQATPAGIAVCARLPAHVRGDES
jgi:two-component system sensor histidine kinase UhpB